MRPEPTTLSGRKARHSKENVPRTRPEEGLLSGPAQSRISWWRASQGPRAEAVADAGAQAGQARDSPPGRSVIPVFGSGCWVRPSSLSVSALQLCSDFPRLSQLQVSAALGVKAQSPTPPPWRAHAHTHLKQYSSLVRRRTVSVRQRFVV